MEESKRPAMECRNHGCIAIFVDALRTGEKAKWQKRGPWNGLEPKATVLVATFVYSGYRDIHHRRSSHWCYVIRSTLGITHSRAYRPRATCTSRHLTHHHHHPTQRRFHPTHSHHLIQSHPWPYFIFESCRLSSKRPPFRSSTRGSQSTDGLASRWKMCRSSPSQPGSSWVCFLDTSIILSVWWDACKRSLKPMLILVYITSLLKKLGFGTEKKGNKSRTGFIKGYLLLIQFT